MRCPACNNELTEKNVGGVVVDVCDGGCGGIWFDNFELVKFDEPNEEAAALLDVARDASIEVDPAARRQCPTAACGGVTMMQHHVSVKRKVAIDECPKCAGVWLDAGELSRIRELYESEAERAAAAEAYFRDVFGGDLAKMKTVSDEKKAKYDKFAHMFRWLYPSYWLPGKQNWGRF